MNNPSGVSFAEARNIVGAELARPNAKIYWADFLSCILIGHVLFHLVLFMPAWAPGGVSGGVLRAVMFGVTALLYYRAAMFTHELVHLRDRLPGFRVAWNILCGIPFFMPSFTYLPHTDHHRRRLYGTKYDGEYVPLRQHSRWLVVAMVLQSLVIPLLGVLRFTLLTPVCWLIPGARQWVYRHASTMVVDPSFCRPPATPAATRLMYRQEFLCFCFACVFLGGRFFLPGDHWNALLLQAYLMGVAVVTLNSLRTLGAHLWAGDGEEMSFESQLLDSVNYPGQSWLTELWGPVGTRFHALHHMFPSIPYHNLPEAHRRLAQSLPEGSPYHQTIRGSLLATLADLFRHPRRAEAFQGRPQNRHV